MDPRKTILKRSLSDKKQFKTVVVINLSDDLLDRDVLDNHFSKYGSIVKMHISSKNKSAVISYSKASEAKAAKETGSVIDPNLPPLKMFYSEKGPDGRKPLSRTSTPAKAGVSGTSTRVTKTQPPIRPLMETPVETIVRIPETKSQDLSNHVFYPDTPEAKELFARKAVTAEERYRLLEARDKLIRSRKPKIKMRVEFAEKLSGTCKDMCPEKERYMREVQRQLTSYETTRDGDVDHRKAIKAYSRSSADQEEPLPHELRPTPTLEMSMLYILHNIIPKEETSEDLGNWYNFVWDRMRSTRKDITQQQLFDIRAVNLMEKCARFHIHCSSRLSELDRHAFDPKLNDENLMKCLQSLEHMYTDLNLMGQTCKNEPEFRAYQILMNLNEGDILWEIQQKPVWVLASDQVQFAIKVHMAIFEKNYSQFFKLVLGAPYLTACILHRYFFQVRSTALRTIFKAYSMHNKTENYTSLSAVRRVLGFCDNRKELFQYFCESHGVVCDYERDRIILNRKTFEMPDFPSISREFYLIESKLNEPLNVIINGGPLDPNPYLSHCPHTSFDDQGFLIPGELIGVPDKRKAGAIQESFSAETTLKPTDTTKSDSSRQSWTLPTSTSAAPASSSSNIFKQPSQFPSSFSSFQAPRGSETSANIFEGSKALPKFGEGTAGINVFEQPKSFPKFGDSRGSPGANLFKPQPTPGLFTLPISEPVFSKPLPPPGIDPRLKNEKLNKVTEKCWNDLVCAATKRICEKEISNSRQELRALQEKKALIDKKAFSIYAQLEQSVIENEVKMFWVRRRQIQLIVNRRSEQICSNMLEKQISRAVLTISQAIYAEATRAREKKLQRLSELMSSLKIRFCISKWKRFASHRKSERAKDYATKLKELENFPAYQNTSYVSPEQLLTSWCGGLKRRSLPILPVSANYKNYSRPPLTKQSDTRGGAKKFKENVKDEDILKMIELYDFPASSNINNASPASVLSSWCWVDSDAGTVDTSKGSGADPGLFEAKKRRLDMD